MPKPNFDGDHHTIIRVIVGKIPHGNPRFARRIHVHAYTHHQWEHIPITYESLTFDNYGEYRKWSDKKHNEGAKIEVLRLQGYNDE